jgi:hypothetical protein
LANFRELNGYHAEIRLVSAGAGMADVLPLRMAGSLTDLLSHWAACSAGSAAVKIIRIVVYVQVHVHDQLHVHL